jgi:hypothetical protein
MDLSAHLINSIKFDLRHALASGNSQRPGLRLPIYESLRPAGISSSDSESGAGQFHIREREANRLESETRSALNCAIFPPLIPSKYWC